MNASTDLSYSNQNKTQRGKTQTSVKSPLAQAEENCRLWLELLPYASPQWADLTFHHECFWRDFLA
jgi:hypothetical protein